jgi:hypothetical protein
MLRVSRFCFVLLSFLLTSCQVYRSQFDCPPGCGVPCTPLTTLEKMIIETDEGPDLFLGYLPREEQDCECFNPGRSLECPHNKAVRKIWIEGKNLPCGTYVEGHYVYYPTREN